MIIPKSAYIYISIFVLVLYLIFMLIGYKKGFVYELMSLTYTALSLLIAWFVSPTLASLYPIINLSDLSSKTEIIERLINLNPIINTILYFIIVFLILKLICFVLSFIFKSINKVPVLGTFNQILGLIMGIINATIVTLVLSMLLSLPIIKNGQDVKNNTILYLIDEVSTDVLNVVVKNINVNKIKENFSNFKVETFSEDIKALFNANE